MIILSWNCMGLGHPCAVSLLRDLVRSYKSDVIFLFETLSHAIKIENVRVWIDRSSVGGLLIYVETR